MHVFFSFANDSWYFRHKGNLWWMRSRFINTKSERQKNSFRECSWKYQSYVLKAVRLFIYTKRVFLSKVRFEITADSSPKAGSRMHNFLFDSVTTYRSFNCCQIYV